MLFLLFKSLRYERNEFYVKIIIYASDEFEGRNTGQPGQKKAVEYLKSYYVNKEIK